MGGSILPSNPSDLSTTTYSLYQHGISLRIGYCKYVTTAQECLSPKDALKAAITSHGDAVVKAAHSLPAGDDIFQLPHNSDYLRPGCALILSDIIQRNHGASHVNGVTTFSRGSDPNKVCVQYDSFS